MSDQLDPNEKSKAIYKAIHKAIYWDLQYRKWRPVILVAPLLTFFLGILVSYFAFTRGHELPATRPTTHIASSAPSKPAPPRVEPKATITIKDSKQVVSDILRHGCVPVYYSVKLSTPIAYGTILLPPSCRFQVITLDHSVYVNQNEKLVESIPSHQTKIFSSPPEEKGTYTLAAFHPFELRVLK